MKKSREYQLYRAVCVRIGLSRPLSRREYDRQNTIIMFAEDDLIIKTIRALVAEGILS